jgi:hypothetical protein
VRILNLKLVGWLTILALLWLSKLGKEKSMRVTHLISSKANWNDASVC